MPTEAIAATLRVTQVLGALQIPYFIGGSMASTSYGRVRATMDVDIIADLMPEQVEPLADSLSDEYYVDPQMIHSAIIHQSSFNLIHLTTMFKVDIFIAGDEPFAHQQLARRRLRTLEPPDQDAYVASPEDVILAKLAWYRQGGEVSERQWQDIQGIFDIQGNGLDQEYMSQWAALLEIADLLDRAIQEYSARKPG